MDAETLVNGGALGILGMGIFYVLKVALPLHLAAMRGVQASLEGQQKVLARLAAIILQHDATNKGQNAETLGTTEEIMSKVLGE